MNTNYSDVLLQWLFLFGLISIFIIPAFVLRHLARRKNKKGWIYFIVGLVVGLIGLQVGKLVATSLRFAVNSNENPPYLSIVMFLAAYFVIGITLLVLKKTII